MQTVVAAVLVAILAGGQPAGRQSVDRPPRFQDYPVADIFRGRPRAPMLSTRKARDFRTQLRRQAPSGPNFAGRFTVAMWGCGAGCADLAIIDARTGEVRFAPFSSEDAWKDGHIVCSHGLDFEITSELLIAQGEVNGKVGRHYFRWHNRTFVPLRVEPCSI
jgi:hypothetical protein